MLMYIYVQATSCGNRFPPIVFTIIPHPTRPVFLRSFPIAGHCPLCKSSGLSFLSQWTEGVGLRDGNRRPINVAGGGSSPTAQTKRPVKARGLPGVAETAFLASSPAMGFRIPPLDAGPIPHSTQTFKETGLEQLGLSP